MDENEFRAEIAEIFREQDRRMERLDQKINRLEEKVEKNAEAIEKNAEAIEKSTEAISKLTSLWTDFIETYSIRDVTKNENIADLNRRMKRVERKLGLN